VTRGKKYTINKQYDNIKKFSDDLYIAIAREVEAILVEKGCSLENIVVQTTCGVPHRQSIVKDGVEVGWVDVVQEEYVFRVISSRVHEIPREAGND
jgi:hypothetical protein